MTRQPADITVADVQHEGEAESYKVVTISNLTKDQVEMLRCILQADEIFADPEGILGEWGFDPGGDVPLLEELNDLGDVLERAGH